jgi:hypothetical protein
MIKYNHLVANLVILYNVTELTKILNKAPNNGVYFDDEILKAISPYWTEYINRFGKYAPNFNREIQPIELNILT